MGINRDKPDRWKEDIAKSVDMYNDWFMNFAPKAFRTTRITTTQDVKNALRITNNLTNVSARVLKQHPEILPMLRMATCPPIAADRLIGLAKVSTNLVRNMEKRHRIPPKMGKDEVTVDLEKIGQIIMKMADVDICVWLDSSKKPSKTQIHRASTVIADRLCGSVANPIIRNAQEQRQLNAIATWLTRKGYKHINETERKDVSVEHIPQGTFSFRMNAPVHLENDRTIHIPIDVVVMPLQQGIRSFPIFIEAKSAGDFTNVNKRRKEEAAKMNQLRKMYGQDVSFNLFLCGYFDSGYLGYEAAEGIDWIWEHRIDDLADLGL